MPTEQRLEELAYGLGRRFAEERERLRETAAAIIADVEMHKTAALVEVERAIAKVKDGEQGPRGEQGEKGDPGAAGEPGEKGEPGEPGEKGEPADVEPITIAMLDKLRAERLDLDERLFAATRRFDRLSAAIEERLAELKDGEPGPPGKDGEPGPQGESGEPGRDGVDGIDGVTAEVRGIYDASETYRKLDHVAHNGSLWIARWDNPGPLPGDGWMMGAQGKKGRVGDSIESVRIDGYALVLELTSWKGRKTIPIDLRPLFERYHEERGE